MEVDSNLVVVQERSPKKRKSYSVQTKKEVIRLVRDDGVSMHAVASRFNINPGMVSKWLSNSEKVENLDDSLRKIHPGPMAKPRKWKKKFSKISNP
jgi:transposase-like protein